MALICNETGMDVENPFYFIKLYTMNKGRTNYNLLDAPAYALHYSIVKDIKNRQQSPTGLIKNLGFALTQMNGVEHPLTGSIQMTLPMKEVQEPFFIDENLASSMFPKSYSQLMKDYVENRVEKTFIEFPIKS